MLTRRLVVTLVGLALVAGCADDTAAAPLRAAPASSAPAPVLSEKAATPKPSPSKPTPKPVVKTLPKPGNPDGGAKIPADARPVNTSKPDRTIGTGTPASCTSAAVVKAVARGGIITFDCGPSPVTITMTATAKVRNTSATVVLDGGGKVTLSGGGKRRILYQNTCDQAQQWTTAHCNDQATPRLTVQNLVLTQGNSTGDKAEGGGGGAIFARGGRLRVVNSRFTPPTAATGPAPTSAVPPSAPSTRAKAFPCTSPAAPSPAECARTAPP